MDDQPQKKIEEEKEVPPLYPITYQVAHHSPPISKEEVPEGCGACSTLLIGSYMEGPNETMDYGFSGLDENGKDLSPLQMFQIWSTFALWLSKTLPDGGPKDLCVASYTVVKQAKTGIKKATSCSIDKSKKKKRNRKKGKK